MIETLRKIRSQKGFTLLELLVVVAIIAILATLILTNLNRARKQAQDAKVQSEVKAISDAVQLYQTSNSQMPSDFNVSRTTTLPSELMSNPDPLLKTTPTHPSSTYHYYFTGSVGADGSYTYTVSGNLVSKDECFTITDGNVDTTAAGKAPCH